MKTTRTFEVSPYLGADLTDRYARAPRAIDVCGLTPLPGGAFAARFWTWTCDVAPRPLEVGPLVEEIQQARVAMLDGPQGLARPPAAMRVCERLTGAPGRTPHQLPPFYVPFAGFITVRTVVEEVTDDKKLETDDRKQRQIDHAPSRSDRAKAIKLGDKISNAIDVTDNPPTRLVPRSPG